MDPRGGHKATTSKHTQEPRVAALWAFHQIILITHLSDMPWIYVVTVRTRYTQGK